MNRIQIFKELMENKIFNCFTSGFLLRNFAIVLLLLVGNISSSARQQQSSSSNTDWKAIEEAMGRPGTMHAGEVYRFTMPRSDLRVKVNDVEIKPALALSSWIAFKQMGDGAMVMGDMVLTEEEVNPVISMLQQGGIEQTALHHHIINESPRVLYMHIGAHGEPLKIAKVIRSALDLTKTPPLSASAISAPLKLDIDTKQIEQTIGHNGKINGGVFQIGVPRKEKITDHGMEMLPSMGMATALNFQPTGGGKAAITGDFVMLADEVNPVIRALRNNGIEVTSLHNHSLNDNPRLFYLHFWANDDAVKLARGLMAALDKTNSARGNTK